MSIRRAMTHVLETGFEYMEANNPNGSPKVRGYNIINGNLTLASDGATSVSYTHLTLPTTPYV